MAGVFESYEHQFSTITADITARVGKIPNLVGSKLIVTLLYESLQPCVLFSREENGYRSCTGQHR